MSTKVKNKVSQAGIKRWNLDAYEIDILESTDFESITDKSELEEVQEIAKYSIEQRKKKAINIRLGSGDIDIVKRYAKREGLPYQTLISSVIHKYATGRLVSV
jgi:predicted DNA binding CopG/RHH family protein